MPLRPVALALALASILLCTPSIAAAATPTPIPDAPQQLAASPAPSPGGSPPPSPAATAADPLAAALRQAADQRAHLDAVKAQLAGSISAAQATQRNLAGIIAANQNAIADTLRQLAATEQRGQEAAAAESSARATAAAASQREQRDRRLLATMVRLRYEQHDADITYVLASDSLPDLFDRAATQSQLAQRSSQLLTRVRQDAADAEEAERADEQAVASAQLVTQQLSAQRQALQLQTSSATALVAELGQDEQAAAAQIARTDAEDLAVAQQIADLRIQELDRAIAAAEDAAWQAARFYVANHLGSLSTTVIPSGSGALLWPVPGAEMSQPFGPSPYPFEPAFGPFPHFHTGIDMAAGMDTPVLAAADGVVVAVTPGDTGYGNHVIIAHSPVMLSLYGHLDAMLVRAGDTVHRGQPIGLLGSTGNSTGPHLHFELRINGVPIDSAPRLTPPS